MKKIYYILTLLLCVYVQTANAQMGVNSTGAAPAASSILDVSSTTKGFLMPRMTTTQRNAIPFPATGLMIFNTTTAEIEVQRGLGWVAASRMAVPFIVSGSTAFGGSGIIDATNSGAGFAVRGFASGGGLGVYGIGGSTGVYGSTASGSGTGVYGETDSYRGVWGRGLTTGDGVYGDASTGRGVKGVATSSGTGVYGEALLGSGNAVIGEANSGYGGYFRSVSGTGIAAISTSGYGIVAENTSATIPVVQVGNLSGGTGIEVIASTALKITGAIKVAGGITAQPAFKIVSVAGNIFLNQLIIPSTTQANNINDIVMITHNYGAGATNNFVKPCGVYWEPGTLTWRIFVEDGTAMPVGITFNVLVIKQ